MIEIRDIKPLQATALLFKDAERSVQEEMKRAAKAEIDQEWLPTLSGAAATRMQAAGLVDGAQSFVNDNSFQLSAARAFRPLSGGLVPAEQWQGIEFGMTPKQVEVTIEGRHRKQIVGKQFGPRRRKGNVVYPSVRVVGPRVVGAWVYGMVRGFARGNRDLETTRGN